MARKKWPVVWQMNSGAGTGPVITGWPVDFPVD
jgi:hypothetical protein